MVVPPERRATLQTARKGASRKGFDALPPDFMLRALRMRYGHSTRRAPRIRANASETRLMGNVETGSGRRTEIYSDSGIMPQALIDAVTSLKQE